MFSKRFLNEPLWEMFRAFHQNGMNVKKGHQRAKRAPPSMISRGCKRLTGLSTKDE